ncbi:hypothetical protein SLEP1_g24341 [Rubroshorea leprosula]|uniref:Transposase n=1 Tax=Rubroshorea leprosula TaxID=152421 RepID=A0AAV5JFC4_9ROSI|nr:hypothetical protein SLEP1_g24341 [Rubroshorea leprosula]
MRCCAHILNLIVNEGLKNLHDSILKIRNAIRYVRASPSRMQRFKGCVEREKIQCKSLVCLDVSTRWNSTYLMLEAALKFQKAFERLHDTDGLYLMEFSFGENVSERKKGPPEFEDWENAEKIVKFLKVFYDATVRISGSTHVTSHMYFHDFSTILNLLNKWSGSNDPLFSTIAEKMREKHEKYWGAASNMNVLIFIACVLDPRYKLSFVEFVFGKLYDRITVETLSYKVKSTLNKMFEEYCTLGGFMDEDNSNSNRPSSQGKDDEAINDDFSMFADLYEEKMSMENEEDGKNEVDLYLAEDKEKKSDKFHILNWWKVNSSRYPILSLIARDVFAVPMSTVASESAFSTGGRVLDPYRSSLSPKTVEILICTQNWFRSTPLLEKMETQEVADEIEQEIAKLSNDFVDLEL